MVTEIKSELVEFVCGQYDSEEPLPCRKIFDISSSRQTCIAKACGSGRANSAAIDLTQVAAHGISEIAPLKT